MSFLRDFGGNLALNLLDSRQNHAGMTLLYSNAAIEPLTIRD